MENNKYYETASSHFVSRFQMRDNVLLLYLAAVGAIFGVAFGSKNNFEVLLTIPYIALGCSYLIAHHNVMLGALLSYLNKVSSIDNNNESFERSQALDSRFNNALNLRTWGQMIILLLPALTSLLLNYKIILCVLFPEILLLGFGLICFILAIILLWRIHKKQKKLKPSLLSNT